MRTALAILLAAGPFVVHGAEPARAKKIIEWGWDEPDTRFIRDHIKEMEDLPFDGLIFHVTSSKGGNLTWEMWGNRKFELDEFRHSIENLKGTAFRRLTDRFLRVNVTPGNVDWFDDQAWAVVRDNFGVASQVAKEGGCKGFMFDVEQYEYVKALQRAREGGKETPTFTSVKCQGTYRHHLQGICTNEKDAIYWCFTTTLVKTDTAGRVLRQIPVGNHHGDLCHQDGRLYVAVNLGRFNDPDGNADSWVYVYDANDLSFASRHKTPEVFHGAGGIGCRDGRFFVVGGLPEGVEENYVYEYDADFRFAGKHVLKSGHTHLGIQTATFAGGHWWFGCYGDPKVLLKTGADFNVKGRHQFDCSLGIAGLPDGRFLVAGGRCDRGKDCTGWAAVAGADEEDGLRILTAP